MSYVESMTLEQLAVHFKNFSSEDALNELRRRDRLSELTYDQRMGLRFEEPDNQMLFEFARPETDTSSVKDEWHEAYEAGFVAGKSAGKKEFMGQYLEERLRLAKEIEENEIVSGHGGNDTESRHSEA